MSKSKIEWTEVTWNPTTGCNKISTGCKYCYAEIFAKRLKAMGSEKYSNGFKITLHPKVLDEPYKYRNSKIIFVNSMSDLFHKDIPLDFLHRIFKIMNETPQHIYQVLTKRAERLYELNNEFNWTKNIWMGVSVENENVRYRIELLNKTNASTKFLSLEPLLSPLPNLNLSNIDWVIVGGESGRKSRPIKEEWILDIKEQCVISKTKFFFKQWGGMNKKANGRELQGKLYDDMPEIKKAV